MVTQATIAAVATAPASGAVGIVRVSGPRVREIAKALIGLIPRQRFATLAKFCDRDGQPIDQGIALFFQAPHSYTGEDVLELQGHGGSVVLDLLLQRTLELGARLARPGEFSERAFLNGKIDLIQAEAIADMIESSTTVAARLACRSLQGEFSREVNYLLEQVLRLRTFVEGAIDFPDDDIGLLADLDLTENLRTLSGDLQSLVRRAQQGQIIRDGLSVVIAGAPNAGKSSLLNALAGAEVAIVTDIPGTTRDLLHHQIQIAGMPVHMTDTAGLCNADNRIEQEGVRRALDQITRADQILWVFDDQADSSPWAHIDPDLVRQIPVTLVRNKIDLTGGLAGIRQTELGTEVAISVLTGAGMPALREHLKSASGFSAVVEGVFMARRRHLDALSLSLSHFGSAIELLEQTQPIELVAEDLRQAQRALGEITGEVTCDDLLSRIFSSFCIGK